MNNFSDNRSRRKTMMHQATCSECGKDCEVPFRPTGSKPVYCSECFENMGGGASSNKYKDRDSRESNFRRNKRDFGRSRFGGDREMFEATCDKCGASCKLPFRPTSGKPVFCSDCFEKEGNGNNRKSGKVSYEKEFESLNTKLDMILELLSSTKAAKKTKAKKSVKKETEAKSEVDKLVEKTSEAKAES